MKISSPLTKVALAFMLLGTLTSQAADAAVEIKPAPPGSPPPPALENNQGRRGRGNLIPPVGEAPGGGNFQGVRGGGFAGGINLDDKQRELLREAQQNDNDALRKLNDQLAAAQKEFVHVVVAEKYDEKVVREKAESVARIQVEIALLKGREFSAVSPTLKPEQREQIEGTRFSYGFITGAGAAMGGGLGGGMNFNQVRGGPPDQQQIPGGGRRNGADRGPRGDQGNQEPGRRRGGPDQAPGQ